MKQTIPSYSCRHSMAVSSVLGSLLTEWLMSGDINQMARDCGGHVLTAELEVNRRPGDSAGTVGSFYFFYFLFLF